MGISSPRQVILVSSRAEIDIMGRKQVKDNLITLAWHMPVSFSPELFAIAIGKTRFSSEIILKSGVFVVNFLPYEKEQEALFCGTSSGKVTDKFKESGLTKEEAVKIDCPRIKEALGYLECEVLNQVEAGDHIIFIGKVLSSNLKHDEKRLFQASEGFTTTVD